MKLMTCAVEPVLLVRPPRRFVIRLV